MLYWTHCFYCWLADVIVVSVCRFSASPDSACIYYYRTATDNRVRVCFFFFFLSSSWTSPIYAISVVAYWSSWHDGITTLLLFFLFLFCLSPCHSELSHALNNSSSSSSLYIRATPPLTQAPFVVLFFDHMSTINIIISAIFFVPVSCCLLLLVELFADDVNHLLHPSRSSFVWYYYYYE